MSKFIRLSLATLLVALASVVAFGQATTTGAIGGSANDPNGAVVPSAAVTVTNNGTNKVDNAVTDSEGRFRVANLQPGTYTVNIKASGFGDYTNSQVVVEVGQVTNVDASLAIGGGSVTVDIATTAAVNVDNNTNATNINQTSISELPINGRRWSGFALLTPGAAPDGNFGLISFRGISGLLNNNTIDGGDNNQAFFSEERGRTRISYSISQSAIREFQVNTSNYSAEYGRAAGGVTNAVTKSGTNEFHGDAFYYQRNNKWGARNPLAFQTVLVGSTPTPIGIKPVDVRHQFGGTIGGPIKKDKAFFFFSYDEQRRNFPGLAIYTSPSYLSTVNRATTGAGLMAPTRNLSTAQIDGVLTFINSLTGEVPRRGDQRLFFPKVDINLNDKNQLTVSYNNLRWKSPAGIQTQPTNTLGRRSFGDDFVKVDSLQIRLQSTLSPTLLNEFRFQYGRDLEYENSQTPLPGEPLTGINGSAPDIFLTNGIEFGKPTFLERAKYPDERRLQFTDNITWSRGSHSIKFGTDITPAKDDLSNLRLESGGYSYNNINDFIIDYLNFVTPGGLAATVNCSANPTRFRGKCYTSNYNQGFGVLGATVKTTDFAFYVQDDWRMTSRLTVNLGVRYEYERVPQPFLPNSNTSLVPNTNLTVAQATSIHPSDKNNFGPRVGFAYDLTGDGKTSVRGGYGIYFGRIINSTIYNALINTGNPGGQAQVSIAPTTAGAPVFPNTLAAPPAGSPGAIQFFAPNFGQPEIHEGDFVIEREIAKNTAISASYVFSLGRKLPTFFDLNLSPPTTVANFTVNGGPYTGGTIAVNQYATTRPNTAFSQLTEIASAVKSEYQALVLQANRRFTNGLQFQISYTRSRATDTNQNSATFTQNNSPYDVFNLSSESATSNLDIPNKFSASVVYAPNPIAKDSNSAAKWLLNGWTIAPIYQYYSGVPVTGTVSGSAGGAGGVNRSGGSTRFPGIARNAFRMPNIWNVDMRLSRRFRIKEGMHVEFLADFFNLFNRTQVTTVNSTLYTLSGTTLNFNSAFLAPTGAGATVFREREVQFAARFQF